MSWRSLPSGRGPPSPLRAVGSSLRGGRSEDSSPSKVEGRLEKKLTPKAQGMAARTLPRADGRPQGGRLLDSVERSGEGGQTWVWVAWAGAYTLSRLGRDEARDEAGADLERFLASSPSLRNAAGESSRAAPPGHGRRRAERGSPLGSGSAGSSRAGSECLRSAPRGSRGCCRRGGRPRRRPGPGCGPPRRTWLGGGWSAAARG